MSAIEENRTRRPFPSREMVKIAVDAMGGDYAPDEIIKGAVTAARRGDVEVVLVGPASILKSGISKYDREGLLISQVDAEAVIKEGEHPALAVRRKPDASIAVAVKLAKAGKVDAVLSAGSTGAAAVSAIQFLGMMPGIDRPTVCAPLVGFAPKTVLVDGGANVDCKPEHLLSFAVVGSVYAKKLLGVPNPKVALLSVGAEEGKGSRLIQESYPILQSSGLDFIGNIEGNDVLSGRANVIVCDAVLGNVLMKFYESMGQYFVKWLTGKLGRLPLAGSVGRLLDQMISFTRITRDESDGGGLLWGINGVVHLMHGNSRAQQVDRAIARARYAVETGLVGSLRYELEIIQTKCKEYLGTKLHSSGTSATLAADGPSYSHTSW